jgi:hypothetical protein
VYSQIVNEGVKNLWVYDVFLECRGYASVVDLLLTNIATDHVKKKQIDCNGNPLTM